MRAKIILFLTIVSYTSVFAQSFTITGRVIDNDTEEGVPFCNIYIDGKGIGTTSDFDGFYTLKLEQIYDSISVSALGYDNQRKTMLNQAEQTMNFRMFSTVGCDAAMTKPT